jgi:type I restriction enzyme R subunit
LINAEPGYARLQARVREIASRLLDQLTIPAVRAQQELLGSVVKR